MGKSLWAIRLGLLYTLLSFCSFVHAQEDTTSFYSKALSFPDQLFGAINKKASHAEQQLDKQTDKYLHKLAKQENKLKKKLLRKDPQLALSLFPHNIDSAYQVLKAKAGNSVGKYAGVYSGHLDSLSTALNFLKSSNLQNISNNPEVTKALDQYKALQNKFNGTDQIKGYIEQRKQLLKQQFQSLGMVRQYKQFQKEVYYYKAQIEEYKQSFEDPTKVEQQLMQLAMKVPLFKDFFAKNSQLGQLFALPTLSGNSNATASLAGLQTRTMLNQTLQQRFGSATNVNQLLQQNVSSAQGQLQSLKDKVNQYSSGSFGNTSSDPEMPQGFKPNTQKTKSFLKRLEVGGNIQSQKARSIFPVTSDLALTIGYKLNDKSVVGIGAAYKIGWGSGFQHIQITHQGVGLRSYVDWKLKGSFWISGGYELNYQSQIQKIDQLRDYSSWQKSGLIGLTKKYQISKKVKGNLQLLWDFLSYQQVPKTQPILFRIGYSLR